MDSNFVVDELRTTGSTGGLLMVMEIEMIMILKLTM